MSKLKQQLYLLCGDYIKKKESEIRTVIAEAQDAANNETKSSAGDKFETGRAIMQQEIELNLERLSELNKMKQTLERIIPDQKGSMAQAGSVVCTNNGSYYIAIGAGQLRVDGKLFYAISVASPIGAKLAGQKAGASFTWNGKQYIIDSVA